MKEWMLSAAAAMTVLSSFACSTAISQPKQPGITICISAPDEQTVPEGWAVDSAVSIRAAFETLASDFHVDRVWWRSQAEMYDQFKQMRSDAFMYQNLMEWWLHCINIEKTDQTAIETAQRLGMPIYAVEGINDFWTSATAGGTWALPFAGEDKLRIEHPEWIPVNKYGTRRQDGPLEFGYPEARKSVVDRLVDYVATRGYNGLCLYTYAENFAHRYDDEFGFNDVVVEDFKRLYGVDIRTEPFDIDAWAKLRGSYFTELLRELRAGLAAHDMKLVIWLDIDNPNNTRQWSGKNVRTAGNVYMDWEGWVQQGIVDELCISWPGDYALAQRLIDACKGTNVTVSMFHTYGDLPPGVVRVSSGGMMESGYTYDSRAGFDDEVTPLPSARAIKGEDPRARRQWLYLIERGKQKATVDQVAPLVNDPDFFVRRGALRVLDKLNDPAALPLFKSALNDSEHSIRLMAAELLGKYGDAESIDLIFDQVAKGSMWQFNEMVAVPSLLKLSEKDRGKILARLNDSNATVRRIAISVLNGITHGPLPEAKDALIELASNDSDRWNRILALGALTRYRDDTQAFATVRQAMERDVDDVVQTWAAVYLSWFVTSGPTRPFNPLPGGGVASVSEPERFDLLPADTVEGKAQRDVLDLLVTFFRQYDRNGERTDADWGWLAVGNAIKAFGDEGPAALESIMRDGDELLLYRAWQVVYTPQRFADFVPATAEQDEAANVYLQKILDEREMTLDAALAR